MNIWITLDYGSHVKIDKGCRHEDVAELEKNLSDRYSANNVD